MREIYIMESQRKKHKFNMGKEKTDCKKDNTRILCQNPISKYYRCTNNKYSKTKLSSLRP
jgi:hypothetical protein